MKYQVTWTKEQRERATGQSKGLFAVACDTTGGRAETTGIMDHSTANRLFAFAVYLSKGNSPASAFHEAFGKTKEPKP